VGAITACILNLCWMEVVSFTLQPLYPQGKRPRYPVERRLGGYQIQSGHGDKKRRFLPLLGIEPLSSSP